jgi:hypothetical protein
MSFSGATQATYNSEKNLKEQSNVLALGSAWSRTLTRSIVQDDHSWRLCCNMYATRKRGRTKKGAEVAFQVTVTVRFTVARRDRTENYNYLAYHGHPRATPLLSYSIATLFVAEHMAQNRVHIIRAVIPCDDSDAFRGSSPLPPSRDASRFGRRSVGSNMAFRSVILVVLRLVAHRPSSRTGRTTTGPGRKSRMMLSVESLRRKQFPKWRGGRSCICPEERVYSTILGDKPEIDRP